MMIAKNQGGTNAQSSFGVYALILGTLMIVDALFGGIVREYLNVQVIQYGVVTLFAIVLFGDFAKESDPGGRLLKSYSRHGL